MATRKKKVVDIRAAILSSVTAAKTITLKGVPGAGGRDVRVKVRRLNSREEFQLAQIVKANKYDDFGRGLVILTFAVRDAETGTPIFSLDDVEAIESLPLATVGQLMAAYTQLGEEVEQQAKN